MNSEEKVKLEKELEKKEKRLQELMENVVDPMMIPQACFTEIRMLKEKLKKNG